MLEVARIRSRTSSDTFLSRFPPFFINLDSLPTYWDFESVPHLEVIYTPKEAHSRIFVTGGSVIA